jgi:uncharacterized repeat protein (TIGR03806 family)
MILSMKTKLSGTLLFLFALLTVVSNAEAQPYGLFPAFPGLIFEQPVYLTSARDGSQRLFVVEKCGTIQVVDAAGTTMRMFLDLRDVVRNFRPEIGLLGLAFHPNYKKNGRFFVHYSGESFRSFISEFSVSTDPDSARRLSERVILQVRQPSDMHNGGQLEFGPDGYLYIGFGDGGGPDDRFANGQDRTTLLATILRLDVDGTEPYGIPADNPFVGNTQGWREEIWAWGLRNPWRFSFDPHTEELWVGDVGEDEREEINVVEAGQNYGWSRMEGSLCRDEAGCNDAGLVSPVFEYDHSEGAAINGGYIYRGPRLTALHGAYVFGDFGSRKVWSLRRQQSSDAVHVNLLALSPAQITSFGRDELGEIYILTIDGDVLQLTPSPPSRTPDALLSETGIFANLATQEPSADVLAYEVNVPLWSDGASKRRYLNLPKREKIDYQEEAAWSLPVGTRLIKSFYLPHSDRIVETRVLRRRKDEGWEGYSYRWNEEGTEAFLLDGALQKSYTVDTPSGTIQHTHYFPGRHECGQCHTRAAGFALGLRTGQLNRDGQIQAWRDAGLFVGDIPQDGSMDRLPAPDAFAPVSKRARAYLDVNCAHCHRPGHFTRAQLDLRYATDIADTGLFGPPTLGDFGIISAQLLTPGAAEQSVLYRRILTTGSQRMPPLATAVVDTQALTILSDWIVQIGQMTAVGTEDVSSQYVAPESLSLDLPFPSPANGQIAISFQLSATGLVRLELFDTIGQRVDLLLAQERPAGVYMMRWETQAYASGVYFLRLVSGGETRSRRLVVLK